MIGELQKHEYTALLMTFVGGGGLMRIGHYIGSKLPPLPANAGWWQTLFYNLVKD